MIYVKVFTFELPVLHGTSTDRWDRRGLTQHSVWEATDHESSSLLTGFNDQRERERDGRRQNPHAGLTVIHSIPLPEKRERIRISSPSPNYDSWADQLLTLYAERIRVSPPPF